MGKLKPIAAVLLLVGFSIAFSWKYLQTYGRAEQSPGPIQSPVVPPMSPRYRESLASGMSNRITEQVFRYHADHHSFPPAAAFWKAMEGYCEPIHNPLNGSDEVVPMTSEFDSARVGWVYDERGGVVFPGVVFNSRPATQP